MRKVIVAALALLALLALLVFLAGRQGSSAPAHARGAPLLAGETTYGTTPAFLFGVNDSVNWDPKYGFDTAPVGPAIQAQLKAAHVPIARTWFFENSLVDGHRLTDAEQLAKLHAVQHAGMICFALFDTGNSQAYDLHLLDLLKGACPYVEVMNEPDLEGVSSAEYLTFWKSFVPAARAAHPGILFGGPALSNYQGNECDYGATTTCYMQKALAGMAASGVLPDFVSFHDYPCWDDSATSCMRAASTYSSAAHIVIDWTNAAFPGKNIPVLLTEWNADPGNPSYMNDGTWMRQYLVAAYANIEQSGLSGAFVYDIGGEANWGADDLFDVYNKGVAKPQFTSLVDAIAQAQGVTPPTIPTESPTPTPANTSGLATTPV